MTIRNDTYLTVGPRAVLMQRIVRELDRAYEQHGRTPWSRHEFFAILREEVDELWDAIKHDEPMEMIEAEVTHVAAVCFRYFETLIHPRNAEVVSLAPHIGGPVAPPDPHAWPETLRAEVVTVLGGLAPELSEAERHKVRAVIERLVTSHGRGAT